MEETALQLLDKEAVRVRYDPMVVYTALQIAFEASQRLSDQPKSIRQMLLQQPMPLDARNRLCRLKCMMEETNTLYLRHTGEVNAIVVVRIMLTRVILEYCGQRSPQRMAEIIKRSCETYAMVVPPPNSEAFANSQGDDEENEETADACLKRGFAFARSVSVRSGNRIGMFKDAIYAERAQGKGGDASRATSIDLLELARAKLVASRNELQFLAKQFADSVGSSELRLLNGECNGCNFLNVDQQEAQEDLIMEVLPERPMSPDRDHRADGGADLENSRCRLLDDLEAGAGMCRKIHASNQAVLDALSPHHAFVIRAFVALPADGGSDSVVDQFPNGSADAAVNTGGGGPQYADSEGSRLQNWDAPEACHHADECGLETSAGKLGHNSQPPSRAPLP